MENNESQQQPNPSHAPYNHVNNNNENFQLNHKSLGYLVDAAKWAKLISLISLCLIGVYCLLIIAFFIGFIPAVDNPFSSIIGIFPMFFFVGLMIICAIPMWWLYQFSIKINYAVEYNNDLEIENAFQFLKNHYKFIGIASIVIIAAYSVSFVIGFMILLPS